MAIEQGKRLGMHWRSLCSLIDVTRVIFSVLVQSLKSSLGSFLQIPVSPVRDNAQAHSNTSQGTPHASGGADTSSGLARNEVDLDSHPVVLPTGSLSTGSSPDGARCTSCIYQTTKSLCAIHDCALGMSSVTSFSGVKNGYQTTDSLCRVL